jgi:hypothetical protein
MIELIELICRFAKIQLGLRFASFKKVLTNFLGVLGNPQIPGIEFELPCAAKLAALYVQYTARKLLLHCRTQQHVEAKFSLNLFDDTHLGQNLETNSNMLSRRDRFINKERGGRLQCGQSTNG